MELTVRTYSGVGKTLGWGQPPRFLQQLTQGQNVDPNSCSYALLQGAHMALTTSTPVHRNINLVTWASRMTRAPFTSLPPRVKSSHLQAEISDGQVRARFRAFTNTMIELLSCSARRGSKRSAKATELPAPSFQLQIYRKNPAGEALSLMKCK